MAAATATTANTTTDLRGILLRGTAGCAATGAGSAGRAGHSWVWPIPRRTVPTRRRPAGPARGRAAEGATGAPTRAHAATDEPRKIRDPDDASDRGRGGSKHRPHDEGDQRQEREDARGGRRKTVRHRPGNGHAPRIETGNQQVEQGASSEGGAGSPRTSVPLPTETSWESSSRATSKPSFFQSPTSRR